MVRDKIYFLSDIHLGAKYIDDPRGHEATVVAMLEEFGKDAEQIYLLGDVLDYWFEYRTVVPRGYIRFFGALARLVDNGVKITWLIGNHDIWMFDYLRDEIGIEVVDGAIIKEIAGKRFYLAHGDDLGRLNKKSFRLIRKVFRNRVCQKLYSAIHPRWTVPFAYRWSSGSRKSHSDSYEKEYMGDKEPAEIFAKEYLSKVDSEINYFILGHRHIEVERDLSETCKLIVLGECYKRFSYAVWNGADLQLKHFDAANTQFNSI